MSKESVKRVEEYIARRKKSRGIDVEHVHSFDVGPDCGVELLLSDIEAILSAAAPQVVADEQKKQDGIEAAELQTLLITEFECYRPTYPAGLMAWAKNALLDCSPHRAAAPVQAQEPVADIDDAFSIAAAGCMFGNADAVESAKHWFKAGHAMGRGAAVREYIDNGTFPAPAQPVAVPDGWKLVPVEPTDAMILGPGALRTDGKVARIHRDVWKRMLAAAPTAPAAQGDVEKLLATLIDNVDTTGSYYIYFKDQKTFPREGWEEAFDIDKWLAAASAAIAAKAAS